MELTGAVATATSDPAAARLVAAAARQAGLPLVPAVNAEASDDACAFMHRVQRLGGLACYLALGAGDYGPHHSPGFDIGTGPCTAWPRLPTTLRDGRGLQSDDRRWPDPGGRPRRSPRKMTDR